MDYRFSRINNKKSEHIVTFFDYTLFRKPSKYSIQFNQASVIWTNAASCQLLHDFKFRCNLRCESILGMFSMNFFLSCLVRCGIWLLGVFFPFPTTSHVAVVLAILKLQYFENDSEISNVTCNIYITSGHSEYFFFLSFRKSANHEYSPRFFKLPATKDL